MNAVEIVLKQLQMSHFTIKTNIGGITHEESLRKPSPAGNCANWVLGHLVATRCNFLQELGGDPVWSESECALYDRHAPPLDDVARAVPIDDIWRAFEAMQERLQRTVSSLTPQRLAEKSPKDPKETLGSTLAVLGFHDAYHAGQTGLLRRVIGRPPADL